MKHKTRQDQNEGTASTTSDGNNSNEDTTSAKTTTAPKINPHTGKPVLPRAPKACSRCRRQKLRCDPFRPCALCIRAGVECVNQTQDDIESSRKSQKAKRAATAAAKARANSEKKTENENTRRRSPVSTALAIRTRSITPEIRTDAAIEDGEPPEKKRCVGVLPEPFPVPSFSHEDTENYIQRRNRGDQYSYLSASNAANYESYGFTNPMGTRMLLPSDEEYKRRSEKEPSTPARSTVRKAKNPRENPRENLPDDVNPETPYPKKMREFAKSVFEKQTSAPISTPRAFINPQNEAAARSAKNSKSLNYLRRSNRQCVMAQLMLLPRKEVTDFLIESFEAHVHWFICCIHMPTFKKYYEELMKFREAVIVANEQKITGGDTEAQDAKLMKTFEKVESEYNFSASMLILCVCLLGAHYASQNPKMKERLDAIRQNGNKPIKIEALTIRLSARIKQHLLDLVSIGDLASVSTCVLIGSFYLFYGEPNLSWPILGCAIKVGQTLSLHREPEKEPPEGYTRNTWLIETQTRKRLWWALIVYDRFAAMVYGRPITIRDDDTDTYLPYLINDDAVLPDEETCEIAEKILADEIKPLCRRDAIEHIISDDEVTVHTFGFLMNSAYFTVGETIRQLYKLDGKSGPQQRKRKKEDLNQEKVSKLIESVTALDAELKQWYKTVPSVLKDQKPLETDDEDTAKIFKMQSLLLKVTYYCTLILIHRPMLSYQVSSFKSKTQSPDPFKSSAEECWQSALMTSMLADDKVLLDALQYTHAVSFFGIHLFNAGVVLCISAINSPLSVRAHEAKLAVGRILKMQRSLVDMTPIAPQGNQILQDLVRLVMNREMESIFVQEQAKADVQENSSETTEEQDAVVAQPESRPWTQHEQQQMIRDTRDPQDYTNTTSTTMTLPMTAAAVVGQLQSPPFRIIENQAVNQTLFDLEKVMDNVSFDWMPQQPTQLDPSYGFSNDSTWQYDQNTSNMNFNSGQMVPPVSSSSNNDVNTSGGGGQPIVDDAWAMDAGPWPANFVEMSQTWMWGAHRF